MINVEFGQESENLFLSKTAKSWLSAFNLALLFAVLIAFLIGTPKVEMLLPVIFMLGAVDPATESLSASKKDQLKIAAANAIMAIGWCVMAYVMAGNVWSS